MPQNDPSRTDLNALRDAIDAVDEQLIDLLSRRADLAYEVKQYKDTTGLPAYAPHREQSILMSLVPERLGRFPVEGARAVYREIISACRSVEARPRVAYLGPSGTFAEGAARQRWGECADYLPFRDFGGIFDAVTRRDATYGLVPVENSTAGTIREVLDLLAQTQLTIIGETYVDVHHCLMSRAPLEQVGVVYSKDTALEQCKRWLDAKLPDAERTPVPSTAGGAERAAEEDGAAAIGPEHAAEVYGLQVLATNIEDRSDNRTRFFALGHEAPGPSGHDKTSMILSVPHRPGALVVALDVLKRHGLNMTLIESRPAPSRSFEYLFYLDVEGHRNDPEVGAAIDELIGISTMLQVLGSYPRAIE